MKFYSVNFFVDTIKGMEPEATAVYIVYQVKDAREDKFGKLSCLPSLIILSKINNKEVWDMDEIESRFNDMILITLPKPTSDTQGFANMKITTQAEYSAKYGSNYYPKKYEQMSNNVVKRARESIAMKQRKEQEEMLDI